MVLLKCQFSLLEISIAEILAEEFVKAKQIYEQNS